MERSKGLSSADFTDVNTRWILFRALGGYWVGLAIWKLIVPPPCAKSDIPDGIPGRMSDLAYLCAEVVSGVVLYDSIFFFLHKAMHSKVS